MAADLGDRVASVRKRRGLTQRELAELSDVSLSLVKKIEQGERYTIRLETLRKLAVALRVRTSMLQGDEHDAEHADPQTEDLWAPVRRALAGVKDTGPGDEPVSSAGVQAAIDEIRPLLGTHEYRAIARRLPSIMRDADSLDGEDGRTIRTRLFGMIGHLLVQNRQFDIAEQTLQRAIDDATDPREAAAVANSLAWAMLRQGRIAEAESFAVTWADRVEPRFSRATTGELACWGRLWLYAANASIRDNVESRADDALALARAAAHRIGREVLTDTHTVRAYGPISVAHNTAETYVLTGRPDKALAIAQATPAPTLQPNGAGRLRHRLDVASAHAQLDQGTAAVGVMSEIHTVAPEWLAQQRYARDILGSIVAGRRSLTSEMRELADAIRLEY
ncbi:helix-turn-helix domain-containing protein [Nocardia sp. NPDC058499]|uniref:helix-turn-helix domain-containing protein n=1 Tax=Nocardia sp. NPDC058499 TaxID=3346530 RepID=UPI00365C08D9